MQALQALVEDLDHIVFTEGHDFDAVNIATALHRAVLQRIQDAKPQELCNVLWALAALDCLNPEWLQLVGSHLESTGTVDSLSGEELSQLWQANMAASRVLSGSEATSSASSRASLLPQSITDRCENSLASGYQPVTVSSFQSQVSAALHQLGIPHFEEYQVDGTPLSVDIVIEAPEGPLQTRKLPIVCASNGNGRVTGAGGKRIGPDYSSVQRNLALELVRVTEAAALASGAWLGKGDKNAADQAAVDMMRKVLNTVHCDGVIVIGEGEKDEAPMLYCGEKIGTGTELQVDIAVDPLDGTTLISQGRNGAVSVIALAERGALFDPGPCMYMEKLAVGPEVDPEAVSLESTIEENLKAVAATLGKDVSETTVIILDRPRHAGIIKQCREAGARIRLISDGDVAAAIQVAQPGSSVDVMMGIGGTPEGVIAAAALKCMGGHLQGRLWPRTDDERERAVAAGYDIKKVLTTDDLCSGDQVFFAATGVSDGDLLRGVRYFSGGATTNSIVMRSQSGTVRLIETTHKWAKPTITNPLLNGQLVSAKDHKKRAAGAV
ncbi:hypothetical protein WJX72_007522 [[Myrmecia] bisecta]|uniref:Fructose-bisphosphatase n=1 Tax=[Myrmecia] bisecta TaxID=41462 RepID=A0AAW1PWM9_9CHLO